MTDAGAPVIVTYNFPTAGDLGLRQSPAGAGLVEAMHSAAEHVEETAGIRMVEVDATADAMIRVSANTLSNGVSWATLPFVTPSSPNARSEVAMSTVSGSFEPGGFGYEILLHEIGHALGLKHPFEEPNSLDPALDNTERTVMSYTTIGGPKSAYQDLDVAALRHLYGGPDAFDGVSTTFYRAVDTLVVSGSRRADHLIGVNDRSVIRGAGGDDTITGRGGDDRLEGQSGNDVLEGLAGADLLLGGEGRDVLSGGRGADRLNGGAAADTLHGGAEADEIKGKGGNDVLRGQAGNDTVLGFGGDDRMTGGDGRDRLGGYGGDDILRGDAGDDTLVGGRGKDAIYGGAGADTFVFVTDDYDAIVDFQPGVDVIDVSEFALTREEATDRLTAWRDSLWFDTGASAVKLAGLGDVPVSEIDFIL
jgi:Ca2+-binding RTX toxin-like protein